MSGGRVLDTFAANRWIDGSKLPRVIKVILRCLVSKVDSRTSASHPRFPIVQATIAAATDYSIAHLCRALKALEAIGLVIRRRMRPRRFADGTFWQEPTDYELVFPDECYRFLQAVESSAAARERDVEWSRSVRGAMSERIDLPKALDWKLDPKMCTTFLDDMPFSELAPKLLDAAKVASEGADESLRHRTIVCLDELRKRARDVALLACNLDLSSWDAKNVMRHWVRKCLMNARIKVESAAHGMNILRKFMIEQREWLVTLGAQRIERLAREKRERDMGPTVPKRQTGYEHITIRKV